MFKRVIAFARPTGAALSTPWGGGGMAAPAAWTPALRAVAPAIAPPPARPVLADTGMRHTAGGAVTLTVHARGPLAEPVVLEVASDQGGAFSKTRLFLPAGTDPWDSFSFLPEPGSVATLRYTLLSGPPGTALPAARKVYALADPAAHAAVDLHDAAHAILARYGASKWEMADARAEPDALGLPAEGQALRAVADSGFGASRGNAMEMLNWVNRDGGGTGGRMQPPVLRLLDGRRCADHSAPHTWGFWCRRSGAPNADAGTAPRNRVPYNLQDPHFALVALSVPGADHHGVAFQASKAEEAHTSELRLAANRPQARWVDADGQQVVLTGTRPLAPHRPAVVALTAGPGRQALRHDGAEVAAAAARLAPSNLAQMLIGWGFTHYVPNAGFQGHVFAAIAGKGAPCEAELAVLECYLAGTAGVALATAG